MERKEAIEVIKKNWSDSSFTILREALETLIPEIVESEGERIRKKILKHIQLCTESIPDRDKFIAWLETQNEQVIAKAEKTNLAMSLINYLDDNRAEDCMGLSSGECEDLEHAVLNSDWGKVYRYMKKKLENHQGEKSDSNVKDYNSIDPHFLKPIDKVEPKFKVGDWISCYYANCKVQAINDEGYVAEDVNGNKVNILFENEKFHHLWTIQDAKDGDVLIAPNGTTFLFKNIINGMPYSYCGIDCTTRFRNTILEGGKDGRNWTSSLKGIYPATKEQRDTLFARMKEASYIWNEKELKLEKI